MVYVAFQVLDTNGLNVLLDDIHGAMILPSTDCSAPKDIAVSGIEATSAALSWTETGFASSWAVEYSTSSTFVGAVSQTVTGTPSLSLSGLTDNTVYYVRIKADCLGGEYSEWIHNQMPASVGSYQLQRRLRGYRHRGDTQLLEQDNNQYQISVGHR